MVVPGTVSSPAAPPALVGSMCALFIGALPLEGYALLHLTKPRRSAAAHSLVEGMEVLSQVNLAAGNFTIDSPDSNYHLARPFIFNLSGFLDQESILRYSITGDPV
jgi:hypothetical protein